MSIKTFLTFFLISSMPIWVAAQNSKFAIALQTTTIEPPPPLSEFADFGRNRNELGTRFHKDLSLEVIVRLYLKEGIALRLRTGVTEYDFEQRETSPNFFNHIQLTARLEKYAIGMETNHFFGKSLAFRLGGDFQWGLFKDMEALRESNNSKTQTTLITNHVLSFNPFFGGDWLLGRGFALGAEFRMPFERVRYQNKGTVLFNNNGNSGTVEFDQDGISYVGFGTPISSIQLSYRF